MATAFGDWRLIPQRGEVYWLNFDPSTGGEMQATRPCVIIQNDVANQKSSLTIVVAITSNLRIARMPVGVLIPAGTAGLTRDSVAHCGHIYTVDRMRLGNRLGQLPALLMVQVDRAIGKSLSL